MLKTFKVYIPLLFILALSIFGLCAPLIYQDVYSEVINNSLYMPMVSNDVTAEQHCSDPTKLHYIPCGLDDLLTSPA